MQDLILSMLLNDMDMMVPTMSQPYVAVVKRTHRNPTCKHTCKKANSNQFSINRVDFSEKTKTTVIYWDDGTKTYVKCCEGDEFNKEKGFAMCVCKKVFGEDYGPILKKFIGKTR